jgi:hypothetical protein
VGGGRREAGGEGWVGVRREAGGGGVGGRNGRLGFPSKFCALIYPSMGCGPNSFFSEGFFAKKPGRISRTFWTVGDKVRAP